MFQYEENVKQVEVKQLDDISAEVEDEINFDVNCRWIYLGVKTICLNNIIKYKLDVDFLGVKSPLCRMTANFYL